MPVSRSQRKRLNCSAEPPGLVMEVKPKMGRRSVAAAVAAPRHGNESSGNVNSCLPDRALKVQNINTDLKQRETDKETRLLVKQCAETERRLRAVEAELRKAEEKLQTGARERNALTTRATAAEKRSAELQSINDMLRAKFSRDELKSELGKLCLELAELKLKLESEQQEKEQMKCEFEEQVRTLQLNLQTSQTVLEPLKEDPKNNSKSDLTDRPLGGGDPSSHAQPPQIPAAQSGANADRCRLARRDGEISTLRVQVQRLEKKLPSHSKRGPGRGAVAREVPMECDGPGVRAGEDAAAATTAEEMAMLPLEGPALEQQLSGLMEERVTIEQGLRAVLTDVEHLQQGDARLEELVERMDRDVREKYEEIEKLKTELNSMRESAEEQRQCLQERVEALEREAAQGQKKAPPKTPRRRVTLLAAEAGSELARNVESMESKMTQMVAEMSAIHQAYREQVGEPPLPAAVVTRAQSAKPQGSSSAAKDELLQKMPLLRSAEAENKVSSEAMQEEILKWKKMYDKSGSRVFKVASPLLGRLSRLRLTDRRHRSFFPTFVDESLNAAGKRSAATSAMYGFTGANQLNKQNMFL
ncbi:plectin-like [Lethenteron reissneri]|uniref:plectin-like n=1 Tax=Lethenteron reissneri TaxID=7753 RepID=UPI002AB610CD|nr:plectin-like [Lethenteron reissneri]